MKKVLCGFVNDALSLHTYAERWSRVEENLSTSRNTGRDPTPEHEAIPATASMKGNTNMKQIRLLLAVSAVVILVGGLWWWHLLRVTYSTSDAQVTADISDISPKVSGRLVKLDVSEGDVVTAGQELAELDNAALAVILARDEAALELDKANYAQLPDNIRSGQARVDEARQALANAQYQETKDEIALNDAKRKLDETQALYSGAAASKEDLDAATSGYLKAQATLDADRASVLADQASLQDAQAQLEALQKTGADYFLAKLKQDQAAYDSDKLNYDESFIHAPISGTVVRVPATVGETLSPGTVILSISDLRSSWVTAYVEETAYSRIHPGQNVDVRVDAYPGKVFSGKVIEVGGATQAKFSQFPIEQDEYGNFYKVTQRLPVKIGVANLGGLVLKVGMSARVTIHTV